MPWFLIEGGAKDQLFLEDREGDDVGGITLVPSRFVRYYTKCTLIVCAKYHQLIYVCCKLSIPILKTQPCTVFKPIL